MSTHLRSTRLLWRRVAAVLVAAACAQSCSRGEASAPRPADSAALAAVPAPRDLAAELVVPRPGELWQRLKALVGPSLGLLPANFELLLATLLELPAAAASNIAPDRPLLGALLLPQSGEPGLVIAVRLTSGPELVARVASGQDMPFSAAPGAVGLTHLNRKQPTGTALAVLGDHLLIGRQAADLEGAGPWLVRTLAQRPPPADPLLAEVGESALSGPLASLLSQRWQSYQEELRELDRSQRQAKGRPPDFGDPAALIAAADQSVRSVLDLLSTLQRARLRLLPADDALRLELELEPAAGRFAEQLIADLPAGSLEPLLALPRDTVLALMLRSSAEERAAAAKEAGLGLEQLLGARLSEKDRERLRDSLAALHTGRGDAQLYGLLGDRTLFVRSDVADEGKLQAGVQKTLRALELPAIKAPLGELVGDFTLQSSQTVVGELKAKRYVLRPKTPKATPFEALFAVRGGQAAFVLGSGSEPALERLLLAPAGSGVGADPSVRALASAYGADVAFALFADAAGLGLADPKAGVAPALMVVSRQGRAARLTLSCSAPALSALAVRLGKR